MFSDLPMMLSATPFSSHPTGGDLLSMTQRRLRTVVSTGTITATDVGETHVIGRATVCNLEPGTRHRFKARALQKKPRFERGWLLLWRRDRGIARDSAGNESPD